MRELATYLSVLKDSLNKKLRLLNDLIAENDAQSVILKAEPVDFDAFDETTEIKGGIIKELEKLDEGFDALYEKVRLELLEKKDEYVGEISELKELISHVTDVSVRVQAQEERNRKAVVASFSQKRQEIRSVASTQRVAKQYSQSMSPPGVTGSVFVDSKK